jgi:hypothetical protein
MKPRHLRPLLAGSLLPLLLTALGGCLFEPREPEAPETRSIAYLPRTLAENVWENCRLALINRDTGGWDTAIADNFVYEPDGNTLSAYPTVDWANWDKDAEMGFINSWFATDVTIAADLLNGGDDDVTPAGSGGVAEWEVTYLITVTDNQTGSVTRYRGLCTLRFELQGSYWFLAFWRDEVGQEDPDNPGSTLETLGTVRGVFAP